jgi:hypothetical protein
VRTSRRGSGTQAIRPTRDSRSATNQRLRSLGARARSPGRRPRAPASPAERAWRRRHLGRPQGTNTSTAVRRPRDRCIAPTKRSSAEPHAGRSSLVQSESRTRRHDDASSCTKAQVWRRATPRPGRDPATHAATRRPSCRVRRRRAGALRGRQTAAGTGTTSANFTVSMNCRKRATLPSRISQMWTTGRSSAFPVALPVPV